MTILFVYCQANLFLILHLEVEIYGQEYLVHKEYPFVYQDYSTVCRDYLPVLWEHHSIMSRFQSQQSSRKINKQKTFLKSKSNKNKATERKLKMVLMIMKTQF